MKIFRTWLVMVTLVGFALSSVACQVGFDQPDYGQLKRAAKKGGGGLCGNFDADAADLRLQSTIATANDMVNLAEACTCIVREIQDIHRSLSKICVRSTPKAGSDLFRKCTEGYQWVIKALKADGQPLVEVARKDGQPLVEVARKDGQPLVEVARKDGQPLVEYVCKASDDGQPLVEYLSVLEKKHQGLLNTALSNLKKQCSK